jgi:hypothetical protein
MPAISEYDRHFVTCENLVGACRWDPQVKGTVRMSPGVARCLLVLPRSGTQRARPWPTYNGLAGSLGLISR